MTEVLYLKGARRRLEIVNEIPSGDSTIRQRSVHITQCDSGRVLFLEPDTGVWTEAPLNPWFGPPRLAWYAWYFIRALVSRPPRGPEVVVTIETRDTGDRKRVGSLVARRVVTTRITRPSPGAKSRASSDKTDGWYIDVTRQCSTRAVGVLANCDAADRLRVEHAGAHEHGCCIESTDRSVFGDHTYVSRTELLELSEGPLDPSLFEVPPAGRP